MSERETPVRAVRVDYICECGDPMRATGTMYPAYPPLYQHACPAGHLKTLSKSYPSIEYRTTDA